VALAALVLFFVRVVYVEWIRGHVGLSWLPRWTSSSSVSDRQ
jgi:hypothetical protein